jgi:uncharacterized protein YqeY
MIKDRLPILIADTMKSGNKVKLEALRAVKTAYMNWETAKENVGKSITDAVEISIVSKLVAQYEDTAKQCNDGKHDELVNEALTMASILKGYLPKPATEEEITQTFLWIREGAGDAEPLEPVKKNMGVFIKRIKEMLPNADGKTVSQIVQKNLQ